MSPSFSTPKLKFLADENLRREVVEFLQGYGCDVKTSPKGTKNGLVLRLAINDGRILITHDKDFLDPLLHPVRTTSGILLIRIHPPTVPAICAALDDLFRKLSSSDFKRRLIVLEKDGFRIK